MKKTLILGGSTVMKDGTSPQDVLIDVTGVIEDVRPDIQDHRDAEVVDAKGALLFPLLVDCHVHFREPGLEHKATMETEATAALAGGVGTVCEMPNTIPPTVSVEALKEKVRIASHVGHLKIKFFFGITEPAHLEELQKIWTSKDIGVEMLKRHIAGVKLYLDHSTGDQKVEAIMLDAVFSVCAELKILIVAHCEDPDMNKAASEKIVNHSGGSISSASKTSALTVDLHSEMRPPESEVKAIKDAIALVRKYKGAFHVAHLSTKGGLDEVRTAKKEGLPVTCEVAPHHLFLTTDDYKTIGTLGKMNPPLRSLEDRNALWAGIEDGTVDCVSTDHAPHTLEEKQNKFPLQAPSGVPGVELMFPLLLTVTSGHWPHPTSKKPSAKISYQDIHRLCLTRPVEIFGLEHDAIEKNKKARLSIVEPETRWVVERKNLKTKCGWSPYEGWKLQGRIREIIAR